MSETNTKQPRLPHWMKVPLPKGHNYSKVKNLSIQRKLNTICVSGNCPNKGECWNAGTATFMILGEKCTRACKFCQVHTLKPEAVDWDEPNRLANTISELQLKHAVITSVARDEMPDGGAGFWALTIRTVKKVNPGLTMEVLIPDFHRGNKALDTVICERPEVISHNMETVERLSPEIRSMARYQRSLDLLKYVADKGVIAKTGIMLGLGEEKEEVVQAMHDAYRAGVKVFTLGQYLRPSKAHYPVKEYVTPQVFNELKAIGLKMGYAYVESGPQVRSSYHAERHIHAV